MIVYDTNVVFSDEARAHPAVRAWLNDQAAETLYLTSVTLARLLFGICALPAGKRDMLAQTLDGLMGLFRIGVSIRYRCSTTLCRVSCDSQERWAGIPNA